MLVLRLDTSTFNGVATYNSLKDATRFEIPSHLDVSAGLIAEGLNIEAAP